MAADQPVGKVVPNLPPMVSPLPLSEWAKVVHTQKQVFRVPGGVVEVQTIATYIAYEEEESNSERRPDDGYDHGN